MAWQKQVVLTGDVITSAWGNHIQDQYREALKRSGLEDRFQMERMSNLEASSAAWIWILTDEGAGTGGRGIVYLQNTSQELWAYDMGADTLAKVLDPPAGTSGNCLYHRLGTTWLFRDIQGSGRPRIHEWNPGSQTWTVKATSSSGVNDQSFMSGAADDRTNIIFVAHQQREGGGTAGTGSIQQYRWDANVWDSWWYTASYTGGYELCASRYLVCDSAGNLFWVLDRLSARTYYRAATGGTSASVVAIPAWMAYQAGGAHTVNTTLATRFYNGRVVGWTNASPGGSIVVRDPDTGLPLLVKEPFNRITGLTEFLFIESGHAYIRWVSGSTRRFYRVPFHVDQP